MMYFVLICRMKFGSSKQTVTRSNRVAITSITLVFTGVLLFLYPLHRIFHNIYKLKMLFYWVLFGLCFPKFFRNYDNGQDSTGRDQEDEKGLSHKDVPITSKRSL